LTMRVMRGASRYFKTRMSNDRIKILSRHMATAAGSTTTSAGSTLPSSEVSVTKPGANSCTTRVLLNRPSKLNALNLQMVRDLAPVLHVLRKNSCLLLEGAGERAFCAGGDVASIREEAMQGKLSGLPADFFFEEYNLDYWLSRLKQELNVIQVSVWDGVCMGGGVGLSIHAPIRVATEKTLFAMPEVSIGLFPDVRATYALPRIKAGKEVGLYLAVTGARLGARDCLWAGLATHYVPSERLPVLRERLDAMGTECDEHAVKQAIEQARNGAEPPIGKTAPLEECADAIRECFSGSTVELILESLKKVKEQKSSSRNSAWAEATLSAIRNASPLSVKLTAEVLKRNGNHDVSLLKAFMTEYRLTQRAVLPQPYSDFLEGVRAVLVDKDKPKWSHAKIEDVTAAEIERFFQPLSSSHPRGEFLGNIRDTLIRD